MHSPYVLFFISFHLKKIEIKLYIWNTFHLIHVKYQKNSKKIIEKKLIIYKLIQSIPLIADASSAKGQKRIKQCNSCLKIKIILVAIKKLKMLCTCVLKPIFEGKY
jgi:hypothetical protein